MTRLFIIFLLGCYSYFAGAQELFTGSAFLVHGNDTIGPAGARQHLGGSVTFAGIWLAAVDYTALLDSPGHLIQYGQAKVEDNKANFLVAKRAWQALVTEEKKIEQNIQDTEVSMPEKRKRQKIPFNRFHLGGGISGADYDSPEYESLAYGPTFVLGIRPIRGLYIGSSIDIQLFHDYMFGVPKLTYRTFEGDEYLVEQEKGLAGAINLHPFFGLDLRHLRFGYSPIYSTSYHAKNGFPTRSTFYPIGLSLHAGVGAVQISAFIAYRFEVEVSYGIYGLSIHYGKRFRKDFEVAPKQ